MGMEYLGKGYSLECGAYATLEMAPIAAV